MWRRRGRGIGRGVTRTTNSSLDKLLVRRQRKRPVELQCPPFKVLVKPRSAIESKPLHAVVDRELLARHYFLQHYDPQLFIVVVPFVLRTVCSRQSLESSLARVTIVERRQVITYGIGLAGAAHALARVGCHGSIPTVPTAEAHAPSATRANVPTTTRRVTTPWVVAW